jgi:hypothetical protein
MLNPLYIVILSIILIFTLWFIMGLSARADEFSGCALSSCPESISMLYLKDNMKYYADYKQGSKDYWRAYCGQTQDLPQELDYLKCK